MTTCCPTVKSNMNQPNRWEGDCFAAAFHSIWDGPLQDWRDTAFVVHGVAHGLDGAILHAWAECGDLVYDLTIRQQPFKKQAYYEIAMIDESQLRRYQFWTAARLMVLSNHYGYWDRFFTGKGASFRDQECLKRVKRPLDTRPRKKGVGRTHPRR